MRILPVLISGLFLMLAAALPAQAEAVYIQKIRIEGTTSMTPEGVLFYTDLEEGEIYREERIREEYQKIWDSGIFNNLSIETEDVLGGVDVIITVSEKPILRNVTYQGTKKLTDNRIKEALEQNGVSFKIGKHLNISQVRKAESILKTLLETKGYKDATVEATIREVSRGDVSLTFDMDHGPRIKVKKIVFVDNRAFSDRKLKKQMKKLKEPGIISSLFRRHIYSEYKLYNEIQSVVKHYKNHGFINMRIGEMDTDIREKGSGKNLKKRAYITIPIEEDLAYKVKNIRIKGNSIFPGDELRDLVPQKDGKLYQENLIRSGQSKIESKYGEKGYIFAHVGTIPTTHPETQTVDIVLDLAEGIPYYLRHLEFRGNTTTRDNVLRREFRLREGDLFNNKLFHQSLSKVNQLGFFQIPQPPAITPVSKDSNLVDVTVSGEEQGHNQIEFGGGYSGLEGLFFRTSYSTRNFLGRGEIFELSTSLGKRQNLYSLSFTEPWLFDRPYTGGFGLFRMDRRYTQFNQESLGGSLTLGSQLTFFSRGLVTYRYEITKIIPNSGFSRKSENVFGSGEFAIAQIIPAFQFDTRNNFYRPSAGTFLSVAIPIASGYLGSDQQYYKIATKATHYHGVFKKSFMAMNGEYGFGRTFFQSDVLPPSERFFLGGAGSVRGYEIRSIGPEYNGFVYGGDSYIQFNLEYVLPLNDMMQFALFFDAGDSFATRDIHLRDVRGNPVRLRKPFGLELRQSFGAEFRLFVPQFPHPVRFIWSNPINPVSGQRTETFEFTIGPSF